MIYIEALILYVVLFFSGSAAAITGAVTVGNGSFRITTELVRIFMYNIPSLALIWYILLRKKRLKTWDIKPGKRDLLSCVVALPCLLSVGLVINFVSSYIDASSAQTTLHSPTTVAGWIFLSISCITAAYLEETFFRFYILARRKELNLNTPTAIFISAALFSLCHIYEGPWGFLNSVLSGTLLCFIFLRYKSLHGIAAAHSLYNISVYAIYALTMGS